MQVTLFFKKNRSRAHTFFNLVSQDGLFAAILQLIHYIKAKIHSSRPYQAVEHEGVGQSKAVSGCDNPISFPIVIPTFEAIKVSIIIPVFNQWKYTAECIHSIVKSVNHINYEIIIADDCSTDETINASEFIHNVVVAKSETNVGFLANCNQASVFAKGEYIVLLNNDTLVHENWLLELVKVVESSADIGLVGSKLIYQDGKLQEAGGIVWRDGSAWNFGNGDDPLKPEYNYVKEVDYISAASVLVRATCWRELAGFDTRYAPAYYEDTDLSFAIKHMGYKVVYQPKSVVTHFEGQSHGKDLSKGIKAYQLLNQKKFREKWRHKLQAEHVANGHSIFNARDRSLDRRTILIVDHYVPWFDKDAGSRSTFMYVKFFVAMGYNVKFIGDNFYPHQPYTDILAEMGVEVLHGAYYANHWKEWFITNQSFIDLVYLHRPHIAAKYIDFIKANSSAKILYQCHDLHHIRLQRASAITGCKNTLRLANEWEEKELTLFNKSDIGLTFSYDEKAYLNRLGLNCKVEQIPLFLYDNYEPSLSTFKERQDIMFVGGFNHSPNAEGVLWFLDKVFPLVLKQLPEVKFHIIGSEMPDSITCFESDNVIVYGYVSDSELKAIYGQVKVNVVPLLHGAGVKGKLVESLFYGTPFVATSVGLEGMNAAEYGFEFYDDEMHFCNEVVLLLNDENYWHKHVNKQNELFSHEFLTSKVSDKLSNIF